MNMQSSQTTGGGLLSNLWVQLALLIIGTVVLIGFAAKYLW
jgi:hypothetical protein